MRVYLAGPITEDPETHNWRRRAAKLLGDKFIIDDPCTSKFDRETLKEADGDAEKILELIAQHQAEVLLPKSYQSVRKCDILLLNLEILPTGRPVIGSLMEIAWGYDYHKVIIAIRDQGYYHQHPMITSAVNAWADSVEEAVFIIKEFFTTRR